MAAASSSLAFALFVGFADEYGQKPGRNFSPESALPALPATNFLLPESAEMPKLLLRPALL